MKRRSLILALIFVGLALFGAGALTNQINARELTPECSEEGVDSIDQCGEAGCGQDGDALLNRSKNAIPSATSFASKKLDDIRTLVQPETWNTGAARTSISGDGKEGTAVEVHAYLLKVKAEGGESCNCGLTRRADTDVHFALVDDPDDEEKTSVTAEVTPRVRKQSHPNWVYKNLTDLEGEYVKITGVLMLDTKHIRQTNRLQGERKNKGLVRATNWEIHPVTGIWQCTRSKGACDHGNGWEAVD